MHCLLRQADLFHEARSSSVSQSLIDVLASSTPKSSNWKIFAAAPLITPKWPAVLPRRQQ